MNLNNFFFNLGIIRLFAFLCGLTGGEHKFALTAMNIRRLSQNRQTNRPFTRKTATYVLEQWAVRMWKKRNLPRKGIKGGIFMRGNEALGFIKRKKFQEQIFRILHPAIGNLLTLLVCVLKNSGYLLFQ